jgi:hypothetical protein
MSAQYGAAIISCMAYLSIHILNVQDDYRYRSLILKLQEVWSQSGGHFFF